LVRGTLGTVIPELFKRLVGLRWATFVVVGTLTLAGAIAMPALNHWIVVPLVVGCLSNIFPTWMALRQRTPREALIFGLMLLDIAVLTAVLNMTGGPLNPFGVLYLPVVAMAGAILGTRRLILTVGAAALGFATVVVLDRTVAPKHFSELRPELELYFQGVWIAYVVAATLIAYFFLETRKALAERDRELAEAQTRAARDEKLVALGTLATGTAHELATPLSSVYLASESLLSHEDPEVREDAELIVSQIERCKRIIEGMKGGDEELVTESPAETRVSELIERVLQSCGGDARISLSCTSDEIVVLRLAAIQRALREIVTNALGHIGATGQINLAATVTRESIEFCVDDDGPGFPPEAMERVGEPFFTTRGLAGTGLGMFLAEALISRAGGRVEYGKSRLGGARVRVVLQRTSS
jgi:two-component system, sensor histidine kinase RegB